jgi:hypothetical protein
MEKKLKEEKEEGKKEKETTSNDMNETKSDEIKESNENESILEGNDENNEKREEKKEIKLAEVKEEKEEKEKENKISEITSSNVNGEGIKQMISSSDLIMGYEDIVNTPVKYFFLFVILLNSSIFSFIDGEGITPYVNTVEFVTKDDNFQNFLESL